MFYSDQLLTTRSHVDSLKRLSSRMSELENLFRSPHTGETWCVGTALGEVTSRLNSALSSFDALEIPDESSVDDELPSDDCTKHVDDKCRELQQSVMLVIQSLYKVKESECVSQTEDRQVESDEGNMMSLMVAVLMSLVCSLFNA